MNKKIAPKSHSDLFQLLAQINKLLNQEINEWDHIDSGFQALSSFKEKMLDLVSNHFFSDTEINLHSELGYRRSQGQDLTLEEGQFLSDMDQRLEQYTKIISDGDTLPPDIKELVKQILDERPSAATSHLRKINLHYKNYRDEIKWYVIRPIEKSLYFGSNKYYPEPQWLFDAEVDKDGQVVQRTFALLNVLESNKI